MLVRAQEILKICAGKKIGVSVSGGSDSMCLLDFVLRSEVIDTDDILVINFEHGIRGSESARDSGFVADYCKKRGLKLYFKSADIADSAAKSGNSIETEARLFRRAEYKKLISGGIDYILLAHNLGDRTESVLMHIFRGCGIRGLVGPGELDGYIVRPLIYTPKSEILRYNKKYSVPFVEDSTNADSDYDRNFLRNEVLPLIRQRWPKVDDALYGLSRIANDCHQMMVKAGGGYSTDGESVLLDAECMNAATVVNAFADIGISTDLTKKHINAVLSLANKPCGTGASVPHGGIAVREYDYVRLSVGGQAPQPELPFEFGSIAVGSGSIETSPCALTPEVGKLRFDADKLPDGCVIRTRESGDVFVPYGCPRKLLSDYLTDKKIPKYKRDGLMLVARNHEVYIIVGVEISDKVKLDSDTKNAVEIKLKTTDAVNV